MPFVYLFSHRLLEWGKNKKVIGKFFRFCIEKGKIPQEDELMVDGGGWNEFGKAFLGTVLIAGGVVGAGIGGLVKNEAI